MPGFIELAQMHHPDHGIVTLNVWQNPDRPDRRFSVESWPALKRYFPTLQTALDFFAAMESDFNDG